MHSPSGHPLPALPALQLSPTHQQSARQGVTHHHAVPAGTRPCDAEGLWGGWVPTVESITCITIYNEEAGLVQATLRAFAANIHAMHQREGGDWREHAVVLVFDGRAKAHPSTLAYLQEIGLYDAATVDQHELLEGKAAVHAFQRTLHNAFENANDPSADALEAGEAFFVPTQALVLVKEENAGKLDSHRWFFRGICEKLAPRPAFTVLLDAGTVPGAGAIGRLLDPMRRDARIAGTCGELVAERASACGLVRRAQHYEYKMAHVMDKAMESTVGFISVLPGAFSAYRYAAIRGKPLRAYFRFLGAETLTLKEGNLFLAEDRILCTELLMQGSVLHCARGATATTDVPSTVVALIHQRRRWLNGAIFALIDIFQNMGRFWAGEAPLAHKTVVSVAMLLLALGLLASFFSVALFAVAVRFATAESAAPAAYFGILANPAVLAFGGLALLLVQFIYAMGAKPRSNSAVHKWSVVAFSLIALVATVGALGQIMDQLRGSDAPALHLGDAHFQPCFHWKWGSWNDVRGLVRDEGFGALDGKFQALCPGYELISPSPLPPVAPTEAQLLAAIDSKPAQEAVPLLVRCPNASNCTDATTLVVVPTLLPVHPSAAANAAADHLYMSSIGVVASLAPCQLASAWILWLAMASFGSPLVAALLHFELCSVVSGFLQHLAMQPFFTIVSPIYCVCNLHELAWDADDADARAQGEEARAVRTAVVLVYLFANAALAWFCLHMVSAQCFFVGIATVTAVANFARLFGSAVFVVRDAWRRICRRMKAARVQPGRVTV